MANTEKKKFQFKMPHTYVILVSIMVLMLVLTHISTMIETRIT